MNLGSQAEVPVIADHPRQQWRQARFSAVLAVALAIATPTMASAAFPGQDGEILSFGSTTTTEQLVGIDPATATTTTLVETSDRLDAGTFSPDGQTLAFSRDHGALSLHHLWTANADGTSQVKIGKGDPQDFSPDGKRIAVITPKGLGVVDSDGTHARIVLNAKQLTRRGKAFCDAAAWSPNGKWIAYTLSKEYASAKRSLYIVHPDGSGRKALPSGPNAASPDWSPDGKRIAFSRYLPTAGANPVLVTIRPNGRDREPVDGTGPSGLGAFDAIYAPSGKRILFDSFAPSDSGFGAYTIPVAGGTPTKIFSSDTYGGSLDWQPLP